MKKENTMSKNLKTEAVDHLFDAILCLKDISFTHLSHCLQLRQFRLSPYSL